MAQKVVIEAAPRTVLGKATKHLRKEGIIPANIYGHHAESKPVQLEAAAFDRLLRHHDTRGVVTLQVADQPAETVLVRHVQHNAVTGQILHIDFTRIDATERIESRVPLNFVGEAPAVKLLGGVLLHLVDTLTVECAASDIIDHFDVDISVLAEIDSTLHARDIPLSAQYTLLTSPDEPVVKVVAPRSEEEAPAAEAPAAEAPAAEAPASTEE
jgi:ribosomal protein L25, Ctc-form